MLNRPVMWENKNKEGDVERGMNLQKNWQLQVDDTGINYFLDRVQANGVSFRESVYKGRSQEESQT